MNPSPEPPRPPVDAASTTDAPSPAIGTAHLARFEFSEQGTKILMVEWHPGAAPGDSATARPDVVGPPAPNSDPDRASPPSPSGLGRPVLDPAAWEVSWPGKSTVLPAHDTDEDESGTCRRVYFLLPQEAPIPPAVTVARPGRPSLVVKPLPAIFPEGFDADVGARGVLHTLWAKKRLSELEREMEAELRANAESVGLEMALAEKKWILDNFFRPAPPSLPLSPRSPVPGRLGDKLQGLKLATSAADLVPSPTANTFTGAGVTSHTVLPHTGDVAVPSFSAVARGNGNGHAVPVSLDAAVKGAVAPHVGPGDGEDDLFALPISPRSPDMKKSPFSIL
ncbi:prolyl-tRNA synthetase 1 [Purpureocillium lavendulum]|uniref:Prolyl-tRNA synthetase 1 n=1 Tax=Purpureocillium lavendulum TaxID=1247861 RepID=A0AB34G1U3_9HYPO|nr:prolyl-tRNA synthetase 1 [Purpureocillium lavendulum]